MRAAYAFGLLCIMSVTMAAVFPSCIDIDSTNTNTNQIRVTMGEPVTPAAGCGPVSLTATPVSDDTVTLGVSGEGTYTLIDNGFSRGPVIDGQQVTFTSGAHNLQLTSGNCVSNAVFLDVP